MRYIFTGLLFLCLVCLPAKAKPPEMGAIEGFSEDREFLACDTEEQIRIMFLASKKGGMAFAEEFQKLYDQKNKANEPSCILGPMPPVLWGQSIYWGVLAPPGEDPVYCWLSHVGTSKESWWILWTEPLDAPSQDI